MGRSGYAAAVLSSDSFTAALKRVKYLGVIAAHDHEVLQGYKSSLDKLTERQAEIAKRKEDIFRRQRLVGAKKAELESQRQKKSAILTDVRREKGMYEQALLEGCSASCQAPGFSPGCPESGQRTAPLARER